MPLRLHSSPLPAPILHFLALFVVLLLRDVLPNRQLLRSRLTYIYRVMAGSSRRQSETITFVHALQLAYGPAQLLGRNMLHSMRAIRTS